jgi:hypothetical protein
MVFIDPVRRTRFDFPNRLGKRDCASQFEQNVQMISNATNDYGIALQSLHAGTNDIEKVDSPVMVNRGLTIFS